MKRPAARQPSQSQSQNQQRSRADNAIGRALVRCRQAAISVLRVIWLVIWHIGWRLAAVSMLLLAGSVFFAYQKLPPAPELADIRSNSTVTFLDRNGQAFAWRGERIGAPVSPDDVSPHLIDAIVSVEDRSYFSHFGISPRGIAGAVLINLREGRGALDGHGGSTITQQVAKLICFAEPYDPELWPTEFAYERECRRTSLWRKVKEIPFALAMELKFTKDEILTIYLNRAYLGGGATGFETASFRYFGKPAAELSVAEAAMLAGLLAAPTYYSPTKDLERSQQRSKTVIDLMETRGHLRPAQAQHAREEPAVIASQALDQGGSHFVDWVLSTIPDVMISNLNRDFVVQTTFDRRVQDAVDEAVESVLDELVRPGSGVQAAVVVMSRDGAVLAMLGGTKATVGGQFNRAVEARRQPGSLFKPFVYAAAMESGRTYRDIVVDQPITVKAQGYRRWSPRNYEDRYYGRVSLTTALAKSLNSVAVRLSEETGRDRVRSVARGLGIKSKLAAGPAVALGASEANLLEMTGAYAGILNWGVPARPHGIRELRLAGETQPLISGLSKPDPRAISGKTAQQLIFMLHNVVTNGTGRRAQLEGWQVAGKTGTSQEARDAWFIGFTANHVAGVWMGYDDNTPLTNVTGSGLPAEIWKRAMARINSDVDPVPLPMPNFAGPQVATPSPPTPTEAPQQEPANILESLLDIFGF
ncbi:MAG: transglycosylase domain-containing protein [Rhodobacteraceae bacterium]|nr:transglycosylase domain-containing protein [Paracoccaceae bacterium]